MSSLETEAWWRALNPVRVQKPGIVRCWKSWIAVSCCAMRFIKVLIWRFSWEFSSITSFVSLLIRILEVLVLWVTHLLVKSLHSFNRCLNLSDVSTDFIGFWASTQSFPTLFFVFNVRYLFLNWSHAIDRPFDLVDRIFKGWCDVLIEASAFRCLVSGTGLALGSRSAYLC